VTGGGFLYSLPGDNNIDHGTVTYALAAATPEPGTLGLMGTALLAGASLVRRRLRA
jgi:hypothetical protein